MAFRKAVGTKALDLAEAAFGEILRVTARHHPADELAAKPVDRAEITEGCHGPAQPVRFLAGEIRRSDGEVHRLLLEDRHAECLAQHVAQLVRVMRRGRRRELGRFLAAAAAQIGMHHVAFDRARAHDRHLHHEIVEFPGFKTRQHVDLGPALDLEHADTVALAQHVVDCPVFALDIHFEIVVAKVVQPHQLEALGNAGQHAQRQHIDFHQAERVDIVLVPFDEGAALHRAIVQRDHFVEPVLRQHEATDMLRQVAREVQQPLDEVGQPSNFRIVGIEAALLHPLAAIFAGVAAPHRARHPGRDILADAERLADFAHRAARPVMDHRGGDSGAVPAIAAIDILHHFLAPLMLEVDIDIGRLLAFRRHEARKQQIVLHRIDRGHAEQEADNRIGRRAATLAQDPLLARIADHIVHGEEVAGIILGPDQREFFFQQPLHLVRKFCAIPLMRGFDHHVLEPFLRLPPIGHRLMRIFVAQIVERESDAAHEATGFGDRFRTGCEKPRHFLRRLQMPLGIGKQLSPRRLHRGAEADRGHDVMQRPILRSGIERIIESDQRDVMHLCKLRHPFQPPRIVAPA